MRLCLALLTAIAISCVFEANSSVAAEPLKIGTARCDKVLFLGNSITRHGPAPQIGWTADWGMAASAADKDYVSILVAQIVKEAGGKPEVLVKNIADFERRYDTYDIDEGLKKEIAFQADVVIVAIGENVAGLQTQKDQQAYATAFTRLLTKVKGERKPLIFVRSSFWANETKDKLMQAACAEQGGTYVDISALGKDKSNYARSERKIDHDGVANHPGDRGMAAIAAEIWQAMKERSSR